MPHFKIKVLMRSCLQRTLTAKDEDEAWEIAQTDDFINYTENPNRDSEWDVESVTEVKEIYNPIKEAKASVPWWMMEIFNYDHLELHKVCDHRGQEILLSVYGHNKKGGISCFEAFPTIEDACVFMEQLLKTYPHLKIFGE